MSIFDQFKWAGEPEARFLRFWTCFRGERGPQNDLGAWLDDLPVRRAGSGARSNGPATRRDDSGRPADGATARRGDSATPRNQPAARSPRFHRTVGSSDRAAEKSGQMGEPMGDQMNGGRENRRCGSNALPGRDRMGDQKDGAREGAQARRNENARHMGLAHSPTEKPESLSIH